MTATIIEKYDADAGDNTIPVLSNDPTLLTAIAEDFCFEYGTAASYASGTVPADGAVVGSLANLAPDIALALARVDAVTAAVYDAGNVPTIDVTKGWQCGTAKKGFVVNKVGVVNYRVGEPVLEGFKSFVVMAWVRLTAGGDANQSPLLCGNSTGATTNWGVQSLSGGYTFETQTSQVVGVLTTSLQMIALFYDFDAVAGQTRVSGWLNGNVVFSAVAGRAQASYVANNTNGRLTIGYGVGHGAFNGYVARVRRVFTTLSGQTAAAIVAAEYAANVGRL
mgnify:CR=1 FL=1